MERPLLAELHSASEFTSAQPPPTYHHQPGHDQVGSENDTSDLELYEHNNGTVDTDESSELPWIQKSYTPPDHPTDGSEYIVSPGPPSAPLRVHTPEIAFIYPPQDQSSESPRVVPLVPYQVTPTRTITQSFAARLRSWLTRDVTNSHPHPASAPPLPWSAVEPSKGPQNKFVYPALLSQVAEAFHTRIILEDRVKDGVTYKDTFNGSQAVDVLSLIIKTTDRNLALLVRRALDAQQYFHEVTYEHRLRDSTTGLYQFRQRNLFDAATQDSYSLPLIDDQIREGKGGSPAPTVADEAEHWLPTSVFTLLSDCYSPTCSRDQQCYSVACPRRMEMLARARSKC